MIKRLLFLLLFSSLSLVAQKQPTKQPKDQRRQGTEAAGEKKTAPEEKKATLEMYRVISLERDTTYIDTSLNIRKEYSFNYLRRDNFGLLAFPNDGQTYNTLDFGLEKFSPFPEFGYRAKHFNYMEVEDMRYYQVATPLTELYFKTTIQQGQSLDAFITLNTSERFNFSLAYKGLRSLGRYLNSLSSTGNFRFTTSYNSKTNRYDLKAHITGQDYLNGENGGIINLNDFESGDAAYDDRVRLQVYLTDAEAVMKGNRYFFDHRFRVNKTAAANNLYVTHQFHYENKFFEYSQPTVETRITGVNGSFNHFGEAYASENVYFKSRYNRMYNKAGIAFENRTVGKIEGFVEDFNYHYYYNSVIVNTSGVIPSSLSDRIDTFGGQYTYQKGNIYGKALLSNSITNQSLTNLDLSLNWQLTDDYFFSFRFQKMNKLPNHNFNLYQSDYVAYNWYNHFKNEKINNLEARAETPWINAAMQLSVLKDKLYFSDDSSADSISLVSPKQYGKTINYLSVRASREFKWWKLALDNTVLYQKVGQDDPILNVPELVIRHSFYYTDFVFKKAMFLQTGFTLNYFTKYYANDYNPLLGEFFVQNQKQIGAFPMVDFFVNARVRQTRIYLKAEHFNSAMTGNHFYSAPSYPYKDFLVRFGLVWTFFK